MSLRGLRALWISLCAAPLALLALAAGPQEDGGTPAEWQARLVDTGRSARLDALEGDTCLACHREVGEEWRASMHALAWQDERYQHELKSIRRKKSCYGCHVPVALAAADRGARPEPREELRHLGVHCTSCHLAADGATVLGPRGLATDAHPSERSELFDHERGSALCVQCHDTTVGPVIGVAKDFVDTEQTELGLSCVGCHMPGLERPWANAPDVAQGAGAEADSAWPARPARSHRLMTPRDPEFLAEAFLFRAKTDDGRTVLEIENQCGHRVPGLLERSITFRAKVRDAAGGAAGAAELVIDSRAFLPVEASLELEVEAEGATLELEGWHRAPGAREPVLFLERRFALGS